MRLGFICEGKTEKKFVDSVKFREFLASIGHSIAGDIIDAKGNGNLLPKSLTDFSKILIDKGAEKIIILTDLDEDKCITLTKERINASVNHIVIVSVKQIEAWFLADDTCMSVICNTPIHFPTPEAEVTPFETIKQLLQKHTGRGVGDKIFLAARVLNNNFDILNAAAHPNCPSAAYFVNKLRSL